MIKKAIRLDFFIFLFCFIILAVCYKYGVHLGLNARITAGFELDGASISIALSRLWFHLHEGYVGYQAVYMALFQILVPTNPNDSTNFFLLSDPHAIQSAFDNVRKILPSTLPHYSFLSQGFIPILIEDVGLADFYTLSFLLFGVHPTSMYNLYFLLFACSILLFIIEYRRQFVPMMLLALIVSFFPVFFFSDLFSTSMPSINSNRFLSTLGFIPIAYGLFMYFKPEEKLNRMQIARIICQALLFAFVLSIRRTAQWQLIALVLFSLGVAVKLYWPYRHSLFQLERLLLLQRPILASTLMFVFIVFSYQTLQEKMMNPIYQTDAYHNGHAVWHSAYQGLSIHSDWVKVNPSAVGDSGDGIGFNFFMRYMKERGLNYVSPMSNTYVFGLYELVLKQRFLSFVRKHPRFAFELYSYYKPKAIIASLWQRLQKITMSSFIYLFLVSMVVGFIFATHPSTKNEEIQPKKLLAVSFLFLLVSWLPNLFAYPKTDCGDDLWMFAIFSCCSIAMFTYSVVNWCMLLYMKSADTDLKELV